MLPQVDVTFFGSSRKGVLLRWFRHDCAAYRFTIKNIKIIEISSIVSRPTTGVGATGQWPPRNFQKHV